jgi:aminopeptidase N
MKKNLLIYSLIFTLISFSKATAQEPGRSDTLDVIHYDIHLEIKDFTNKTINGYTTIKTAFKLPNINTVNFDLLALDVDSIYINNTKHTLYQYNDTLLSIQLASPATTADTTNFTLYYNGVPVIDPSTWGGFYYSGNSAFNMGCGFESIPHNFGRVWFPCIDEFKDRAFYDFYITTLNNNMAVCNGTLLGSVLNGDNSKTWHWKLSANIPTYLASVAVSDYTNVKIPLIHGTDTTQAYIYVGASDTIHARNSFTRLNQIFNSFINNWGPYVWERVGYVSVPFNAGAMEHATNIAYPTVTIDGTLNYESLYAHELAHSWFGNLMTCATAEDMWINEGWARYSEAIYQGDLNPNSDPLLDGYKLTIRDLQYKTFRKAYQDDGGYYPLYPMPQAITYGTTTYDKGALMVHTLRNYMGSNVFFSSVKQVLQENAFKPINSAQFCNRLSYFSGIDLHDFFDAWIYQPGQLHFSVDSLVPVQNQPNQYKYYIHQKHSLGQNLGNSNKVEVTFFDANWNTFTDIINFSGEFGSKNITIPFIPVLTAVDYNEKMADAIVDYNLKIKTIASNNCTYAFANVVVDAIIDSAFIRVEHHWAKPDDIKYSSSSIKRLSPNRYWKIDGIAPSNFHAKVNFNYNIASDLDGNLFSTLNADSLVLVYRPNTAADWTLVPFTKVGSSSGLIKCDNLQYGEYTLAIGDKNQIGIKEQNQPINYINVSPNPSNGLVTITINSSKITDLEIVDSAGKIIKKIKINENNREVTTRISSAGIYYINARSIKENISETKKIIISN